MNSEVEPVEDDESQSKKKSNNKKVANHRSVDDMDFDDPEYLQYQNFEEIKQKRKNELLEEREKVEEKKLDESEEEEEEESNDDDDDDEEQSTSNKSEETEIDFKDDHWVSQYEQICSKFNNNSINLKQFEKLIRDLIVKLDPSKDEDNKKRLCLLTQHLVEFYQSLFVFKSMSNTINVGLVRLVTNIIYELISKYGSKTVKQEPSIYINMFRKFLTDLNNNYLSLKLTDKTYPQLNTVIFYNFIKFYLSNFKQHFLTFKLFLFKLISIMFPTSDFRHHITTPCLLIMTRYFTEVNY